uniref:K Homology domain-containing protein n=1 Tax=Ditylum brightwellii TaxID=49249 RepID=A0A6V2NMJ9_9STRA|mmetsp:Transcript_32847/g.43790  ORF Transcript_32847/g.43790 Transcript_32847/m.43790 type:complete len:278 (+) Transcript_32847:189-1022(+)
MGTKTKKSSATSKITTVLPGDDLTEHILLPPTASENPKTTKTKASPKLGTGLSYNPQTTRITSTLAGRLRYVPANNTYHVLTNTKKYIPQINDRIIGIVEEKISAEYYRVNIFGPHPALLHTLSFENATKRNKPNLNAGSLLYCRVESCVADSDTILSCKVNDGNNDGGAKRKDWMTDEGTYGELKGGVNTRISLGLARELLLPDNVVVDALASSRTSSASGGEPMAFEIAVGVNGVLWVHSTSPECTVVILNAIKNSEVLNEEQVRGMVKNVVSTL